MLVGLAVVSWIVQPHSMVTGWMFVTVGLVNLGRLARWYGWLTWREPLVLILHVGLWVVRVVAAHTGRLGSRDWSVGRGCGACIYNRRGGCHDSGGDDSCQPGPYGASPARGPSDCLYLYAGQCGCGTEGIRADDGSLNQPYHGCGGRQLEWSLSAVCHGLWTIPASTKPRRVSRRAAITWMEFSTDSACCSYGRPNQSVSGH